MFDDDEGLKGWKKDTATAYAKLFSIEDEALY